MYALVEFAGKQFKITEGDQIKVPFLTEKVGSKISIDKILYFDNDKDKLVGAPFIEGMSINAKIHEHGRDKKIIVFKFKRRKGYQRKNGHRQKYSVLSIGKLTDKKKAAPKKAASKAKSATEKKVTKSTTKKKD